MALVKRPDWPASGSLLADFFDNDRLFASPWLSGQSTPAVNIRENEKNYEVELAVPGYEKKDFNISVDHGLLTVSAEKKKEEKERKEGNYTRREFGFTSFARSFNLPTNTNEENIDAKYTDGVLKLTIEKMDGSNGKPRKQISIK